jgi:glycerol-3-phosphate dehydrogenase
MRLHGYLSTAQEFDDLQRYGSDAPSIQQLARSDERFGAKLHPDLPYIAAEVVWSVRTEMALTVEDVLARRLRALFLDANAAIAMAPKVAALMAEELSWPPDQMQLSLRQFADVARAYSCV